MSFLRLPFICLLAVVSGLEARNVFVLPPGDGVTRTVTVFTADPFVQVGTFQATADAFTAFTLPNGTKSYVVGRNAITVVNNNFAVTNTINLPQSANAAALSPDGRRLVVLAGAVIVYDTASDIQLGSVAAGTAPSDVAISLDSRTAYALSGVSQQLTAVDIQNSPFVLSTLFIPGQSTGVSAGPNGLIYVSASNRLYEIDGRILPLVFRSGDGIPLNALPGKASFTPDGTRAVLANQTPVTGSSIIVVDLNTRGVTTAAQGGVLINQLSVAGNNLAYGYSTGTGTLYSITLSPINIAAAVFGGTGTLTNIRSVTVSDETPTAGFLFTPVANILYRTTLATLSGSGSLTLTSQAGAAVYTGAASTSAPAFITPVNATQNVAVGTTSLPIVVRVTDSTGRPVSGATVTFATAAVGATINFASGTTGANGYAVSSVVAPLTSGQFTVSATTTGGLATSFTLNAGGTGGGGGSAGGIAIFSGNGQLVFSNSPSTQPQTVIVRDLSGNPLQGQEVIWTIQSGTGSLINPTSVTDAAGLATNTFVANTLLGQFSSFQTSTVRATIPSGSVDFTVVSIPQFTSTAPTVVLAPTPFIQLLAPQNAQGNPQFTLTAQVGQRLNNAIEAQINVLNQFNQNSGIPGVGLSVMTASTGVTGPTAMCADQTVLSDANGRVSCDLVAGTTTGMTTVTVLVGGNSSPGASFMFNLVVTPGPPARARVIQGDNQTGTPGSTTPLALVAEVQDIGGNVLVGAPVTFQVTGGSATLIETVNRSDGNGRVSTRVRFGSTPGTVTVTLTTGTTSTIFTLTNAVTGTNFTRVSGDGQSASISTGFTSPLVVRVTDINNAPVPNVSVAFTVTSGSASVATAAAVTDASGNASTTVNAGSNPGAVVVTATFGSLSQTFNLTVRPIGPTIASIVNGAGFQTGATPCGVAVIFGTNIAPNLQGTLVPNTFIGPLPTSLGGVSVSFGGNAAPIYSISNLGAQQQIAVQVPCEIPLGSTSVVVTAQGNSATTTINVAQFQPGIFETTDANQNRSAVALRLNGTFVSQANPALRGENIRIFVTGLGQVQTPAGTNVAGIGGQTVVAPVVVGLNDVGVPVVSTEYAPNMIGVYIVTFTVPADTTPGANRPLAVAISSGGSLIFGNPSSLPVR